MPPPVNVVMVVADDLGWGDLGCYGATKIPTPNIDRLASEGARPTDCHSSSAVCTPSRYSILTGSYAWRSPLKSRVLAGHGPAIIEPTRPTLPSVLRAAGYATAAVGKWHLGLGWQRHDGTTLDAFGPKSAEHLSPSFGSPYDYDYARPFVGGPTELGFDRFFGIAGSLDMPPYCFLEQDHTVGIPSLEKELYITSQRRGLQTPGWRDDEVDLRFANEASQWLREQTSAGRPSFLYLATAGPHRPCVPPEFVRGQSQAGLRGDAVCLVDWIVGELTATLQQAGTFDDTLFIVTSDNGAPTKFPEDGDVQHHRPNGPWRGQKADIWDAGHRIPLVARWPGTIPAGTVRDDLTCLTDLLPTIASAAGTTLPDPARIDGVDILPVLSHGTARPADRRRHVVHHSANGSFAIRNNGWKAIFTSGSGGFSDPAGHPCDANHPNGQLYDLTSDPTESQNQWHEQRPVAGDLYSSLKEICGDHSSGLSYDIPLPPRNT